MSEFKSKESSPAHYANKYFDGYPKSLQNMLPTSPRVLGSCDVFKLTSLNVNFKLQTSPSNSGLYFRCFKYFEYKPQEKSIFKLKIRTCLGLMDGRTELLLELLFKDS